MEMSSLKWIRKKRGWGNLFSQARKVRCMGDCLVVEELLVSLNRMAASYTASSRLDGLGRNGS